MLNDNFILLTDSYKNDHAPQYPKNTSNVRAYFEPRLGGKFSYTLAALGLQYKLKRYFTKPITKADIDEAESYFQDHMGVFDRAKWEHIRTKHGGFLPLALYAAPEGLPVPEGNVTVKSEATDPKCWWLPNYAETILVQDWYPATVGTQSREMRRILLRALEETGDPSLIDFKLHDFGCRGVTCPEQAALGGFAHLANFKGTDTVPALVMAREFYGCWMAGFSIPATEHSTITSWGEAHELDAFRNVVRLYRNNKTKLYACVSDSYNLERAVRQYWCVDLKDEVLAGEGTLVVRPDSGNPVEIVPQVLRWLAEGYGATQNAKGYAVLNPKVRVIQGDGIDFESLPKILDAVKAAGFSADNVAFGSGGGLLQKVNRDTQRWAFKASEAVIGGKKVPVQKRPATDLTKTSKAGWLGLYQDFFGTIYTAPYDPDQPGQLLREVYRDGQLMVTTTLDEIRERAALKHSEDV